MLLAVAFYWWRRDCGGSLRKAEGLWRELLWEPVVGADVQELLRARTAVDVEMDRKRDARGEK